MQADDPVTDADLHGFVDDQLPLPRRIAVEAWLAGRPEAAAQVMADMRLRDELRFALTSADSPSPARTREMARRLERAVRWDATSRRLGRIAALGLFAMLGWAAHAQWGTLGVRESVASAPPPAFVGNAVMAHRTTLVRADMRSQPETAGFDPAEILRATAIALPTLPADWRVTDVQIFPSPFGPSVELSLEAEGVGQVSLFAVRPGGFDVVRAASAELDGFTAAYWQLGEVAYGLVGAPGERADLERAADRLVASLY